jgi:transcriptional regulator with XRE-family HTH domain
MARNTTGKRRNLVNKEAHWFTELFERYKHDPEYVIEELKLALSEGVEDIMAQQGLTRSELARRLGTSPAYVTKLLRGTFNPTLETIARIAIALDARLSLNLTPCGHSVRASQVSTNVPESDRRVAAHDALCVSEPMAKYDSGGKARKRR